MDMQIQLETTYKSLKQFISPVLPNFTVIIGKNGAGKTQLLQAINENSSDRILPINSTKNIQFSGLRNFTEIDDYYSNWNNYITQRIIPEYHQIIEYPKSLKFWLLENRIDLTEVFSLERKEYLSNQPEYLELIGRNPIHNITDINLINLKIESESLRLHFRNYDDLQTCKFISNVLSFNPELTLENIPKSYFLNSPPLSISQDRVSMFSQGLKRAFFEYALKRDRNRKAYFYQQEDGENNTAIKDDEFITKNRPPWVILNSYLKRYNIPFYVKEINKASFTETNFPDILLYKTDSNIPVKIEELSNGENLIISLLLKLFNNDYYSDNLIFPELILLDEPDSPLHPENTKLLIDVLNETFVEELGIKVIMTTHSPTTVALSPEDSIYELQNGEETELVKISKDSALNILTNCIPNLSINYKDERYVFVEAALDLEYYQTIFGQFQKKETGINTSLHFIGNNENGGKDQVKILVTSLKQNSLKDVHGIIDWDCESTLNQDKSIVIHGENLGYSLESFLYNPVYLTALLLEVNYYRIRQELNIPSDFELACLHELPPSIFEKMSDWFNEKIKETNTYQRMKFSNEKIIFEFMNGVKINILKDYFQYPVHKNEGSSISIVEEIIIEAFPFFNFKERSKESEKGAKGTYSNFKELKKYIIKQMRINYPLVPSATTKVFREIINNKVN